MPPTSDVLDLDLDRAATADAAAGVDLSPLSWVHDELRRTLEAAHKVLRRFLREAEAQSGSDVSARDVGSLRLARSHIHQGAGALAVVGLPAAARVLDASDAALRSAIDKPSRLNAALLEKVEQGSFAVIDYLGRRLAGKPVSSLLLFPQTRALLEAAGAERVHPADLWSHAWQWHVLPVEPGVLPREADAASLGALEQLTLISMKAPGPVVYARLSELCTALAGGAAAAEERALWQVAAAVFEAQSQGLLQPDVFSKRLASRLLSLLRGQLKGGGRTDPVAAERLAHDLLFFCAQSLPPDASRPAPRLSAMRAAHGLADARPVDYNDTPLGRFDPALVVQARKRVAAAKDSWSAVAAGDVHRLGGLGEQFSLVGDSLRRLFPDGATLADELQQAAAQALRAASAPRAALAMEVATGLLYLEAALEESDFATVDKARPIARLAERIAAVRAGAPPEPMEAWMETLYARVSDRQTLGTVVQELRSSLASAEQQIDQFFRNPHERGALMQVPATLQSMRGVLSVLGVDQAAAALQHMRDEIESLAVDDGAGGAPLEARFERLAGNLGALGFLIDMLGVQAPLARSMFRFDPRTGTLAPLMGRSAGAPTLRAALPVLQEVVTSRPDPAAPAELTAAGPRPAPAPAVDDDMRQVFIEEALEVLQAARVALADWHAAPRDGDPITRLRRAFHTLKGSARMVGLAEFGEAAWGHEQVYNARLAENTPLHDRLGHEAQAQTDATLRARTAAALEQLRRWVQRLADGAGDGPPTASIPVAEVQQAIQPVAAASAEPAPPEPATVPRPVAAVPDTPPVLDIDIAEPLAATPDLAPAPPVLLDLDLEATPVGGAEPASGAQAEAALDLELDLVPPPPPEVQAPSVVPVFDPLDELTLDLGPAPRAGPDALAPADTPSAEPTSEAGALEWAPVPAEPVPGPAAAAAPAQVPGPGPGPAPAHEPPMPTAGAASTPEPGPAGALSAVPAPAVVPEAEPAVPAPEPVPEPEPTFAFVADPVPGPVPRVAPEPVSSELPEPAPPEVSDEAPAPADTTAAPPPWGFPPDLPTAADLDLVPPLAPAPLAEQGPSATAKVDEPPIPEAPTAAPDRDVRLSPPSASDPTPPRDDLGDEGWVEDIGRTLQPPPPAVDLSFISLDLSGPPPVPPPVEPPSPRGMLAPAAPAPSWPEPRPFDDLAAEPDALDPELEDNAATAVQELDLDEDPSLLSLFDGLAGSTSAGVEDAPLDLALGADLVDLAIDAAPPPADEPAPDPLAGAEVVELESLPDDVVETSPGVLESIDEIENTKVIGPLRIGIPLFNIYLNEADELSRRLCTEVAEWTLERHLPLPDAAVEHAHSLAGSSATVGYTALCELARSLEHALARVQAIGLRGVAGREDDGQLFVDAAEEIRRLLHQFAAGFLKSPSPELLARLAAHEHDTEQRLRDSQAVADGAGADAADWLAGIEAVDAVDADLFPIFEEEAQDLLPRLAASLRDWARQPDDLGAADAAMRHLHTFKGGARLAGAMRLGELAHRLESRIERLATGGVATRPADVEALLAGSDALQHAFEDLRASDARAYAEAEARAFASSPPMVADGAAPPAASAEHPLGPTTAGAPAPQPVAAPVVPVAAPDRSPLDAVAGDGPSDAGPAIDWTRFDAPAPAVAATERAGSAVQAMVRVRAGLLDRMVNQAGEVNISRARMEVEMGQVRSAVNDLTDNLERLRQQLHDIELQAETQMSSRIEATKAAAQEFDPLEIDRFTRFQELTRMMAESVNDVATVQRTLKRTVERAEDELAAQTRLTRDLQADLMRTRMVEFDTLAERLHRVVRQAAKETGKQLRLDIVGGAIELDRGMLERLTPAFEHLLRNAVTHGIESPAGRNAAGKSPIGALTLSLSQQGNEVGIELRDDGAGLDLARIRAKAEALGLPVVDGQEAELIFNPGFSTAERLTELAGRGVGLDVVRTEVMAVGGRVEVASTPGQGTVFSLVLPLTTAVTQVLMLRCGDFTVAVPATLVDRVRRVSPEELAESQASGRHSFGEQSLPFFWLGALLQHSGGSREAPGRNCPVVVVRSAQLRVALHVDEVLGHQEAVVKPLGPQLSRLPGLAGMSVLASGAVALIYNPLVLAAVYGEAAQGLSRGATPADAAGVPADGPARGQGDGAPLVLVVDDSLTVRRVTQRLLVREGFRVQLAKDGLEALERIAQERPRIVLSDIEMPRMDGFELVRTLRADAALQDLPVVMISSRIAAKHREHAASLGVDHYLGKPYAEEELLALVRSHTAAAPTAP